MGNEKRNLLFIKKIIVFTWESLLEFYLFLMVNMLIFIQNLFLSFSLLLLKFNEWNEIKQFLSQFVCYSNNHKTLNKNSKINRNFCLSSNYDYIKIFYQDLSINVLNNFVPSNRPPLPLSNFFKSAQFFLHQN